MHLSNIQMKPKEFQVGARYLRSSLTTNYQVPKNVLLLLQELLLPWLNPFKNTTVIWRFCGVNAANDATFLVKPLYLHYINKDCR